MNATSPPPLPAARVASDDIDLFGVLDSLIAHRRLVALTTATFAALAALHAFLSEPQYQADVMIQVDDGDNTWASRGLLGDVSSLFDLKSSTTAETQVFASRLVVSRAADALHAGIRVQPKRFPLIGRFVSSFAKGTYSPGLFGIGGYAWGAERAEIASFDVPAALAGMHFDLTVLGSGRYRISGDALDAPAVGKLGRLETFKTTDGPIALRVERFDAQPETRFSLVRDSEWETVKRIQGRLRVREQIKQSGVFVVTLRGSDPQEVSTLLNEIAKAYLRQNIERKSAEAGQSLKFIYEKLPVLKQQFDEAESRYTRLRATRGSVDATEEARLALQSTADAEAKLLDLQQRRAALSAHFTRSHPDSVVLDTQIAALERERNALRTKIDLMPELQQELSRLWLETHIARNLYTTLLTNAQQLELIKAGINGNVRMVDIAAVPDDFVSPKRAMLIGAATMAGFVAGIALAFARDFLFGGLTSAAQIERHSGLRVLAVMPAATRRRRFARAPAPLLAGVRPSNPALERLREFGEPLLSMLSGTHSNVVLIASPAPGTGASFASANLAAALALEGRRVLLIDGDRHRGELRQYFAGDRRRASCEPPLPAPDPGGAVEHTGIEALDTLDFLPACTAPRESPGDTTSERMRHALAYAAVNYDVVVIDAPPLLATRDGAELARLAGVVLLVARCGVTTAGELAEAAGRLGRLGLAANGVLLNGVRLRSRHLAFRPKFGPYHPVSYRYETTPNETSPNQTVFNLTGLVCAVRRIYGSLRKESR